MDEQEILDRISCLEEIIDREISNPTRINQLQEEITRLYKLLEN